jgi:two-component system, NtrC family, sensor histidine kinase PilS
MLAKSLKNVILNTMSSNNNTTTIYPCPFSKGYGMPASQAWQLLNIYFIYRFILAGSFAVLFFMRIGPSLLGTFDRQLYAYSSIAYVLATAILGIFIFWRIFGYSIIVQLLIFTDIIMLALLMHASGGISSGVGILLAVSMAAGGLLIGGRCALVFAAIASLAILSIETYAAQNHLFRQTNFTYAGMLGATYFAIALLSVVLARRSEQMLQLANRQQHTIFQLEELNQYIVQHLQSGIIIADEHQTIHVANQATLRLANLALIPHKLKGISEGISQAFEAWRALPEENNVAMLQFSTEAEIQCRFIALPTHLHVFFMIILEDIALYNQRLQQSKLASLGRLTASIAHEIRNPLGAISHAGQLLSECPQLTDQDLRLTHIIQTNSGRVNQIIEDILNLSKRAASAREKIDLTLWLNNYLDNHNVEQPGTKDKFTLSLGDKPLWGFIDPGHLKQIMDNLCQNALRYGYPERGTILIQLLGSLYGPCIEVIDNGSGISPEHLKQLFEPFFTTSTKGTGLGLYISRELAELNQAKLSYYLTDGNRSCFRLCLRDANLTTIEL